ncbi:MAG: carboxypeptidase M32, partial [Candidatus Verstraetearchaeota archaeon]|nr:carboxypeptidase M32 [Candidatus Verstraetearchaeota archaeon]
ALGNIYCAQMLARIEKELEGHWEEVGRGNFSPIRGWLKENVHSKGNLYDPLELLRRITGEGVNPAYFTEYLEGKYRRIFARY